MKYYDDLRDSKIQKHYFNAVLENSYWSSINIGGSYHNKKGASTLSITSFLLDQMSFFKKKHKSFYKLQSYREIARITGIPKSTIYDIVKKLDGVVFKSSNQFYKKRNAIKSRTLILLSEFNGQKNILDKIRSFYKRKFNKDFYPFKTKWYQELKNNTNTEKKELWELSSISEEKYERNKKIIQYKQYLLSEFNGLIVDIKKFMINIHKKALDYVNKNYS